MTEEEKQRLNSIAQELALFQQNELRRNSELKSELTSQVNKMVSLENRIAVLENALVHHERNLAQLKIQPSKKSSFWDVLKR